ncbi:MAG: hypothetical protein HFE78_07680 [Clostridiales bacterium]|nr:hypothetical protein [Clostridiales bacterium]
MSKLEEMLKYVSEHNDFYKNRIKEYGIKDPTDITQWPVLTRKELQENRYNMFSDGYKSKYFNQQLRRQSSSGSSGVPVNVYWDYKDWYASNMSLWRKRLQWYGIHPNDKYVMFTLNALNIKNDGETVYYIKKPENILSVNVSLIKNHNGYDKLVDIINDFEPKWLYIQPFVLNKLIQAYKRTDKTPPTTLKYIESIGELLSSDLRRRALEFFEVPLANMYGSEEMSGIAYESPNQQMYVLNDNVLLEIMNENGISNCGEGETIITNLNNIAMPLVRYNQGDIIEVANINSSRCNTQIIHNIGGRKLQEVIIDNTSINAFAFSEAISTINNQFDDVIMNFQFLYSRSSGKLLCKLVLDATRNEWFSSVQAALIYVFKQKFNILLSNDDIIQLAYFETDGYKQRTIIIEE